jgi:hypothetical protein
MPWSPIVDNPNSPFSPIVLRGYSPASNDVASQLANVPTLSELTARLDALPVEALQAAVRAEPDIYQRVIGDAGDSAVFLRALADSFSAIADRLQEVRS